jgi:hypothetical protein
MTILIATGVFIGGNFRSSMQAQNTSRTLEDTSGSLIVNNHTASFEVVSVDESTQIGKKGKRVSLTLRNKSAKNITAFALYAGGQTVKADFFPDGEVAPNGTHIERVFLPTASSSISDKEKVSLMAVLFDDNTSEGNPKIIREIKEHRAGKIAQFARIVPLIKKALNAPDEKLAVEVQQAKAAISGLPVQQQGASVYFKAGLHNAKERVLMDLNRSEELLRRLERGDVGGLRQPQWKIVYREKLDRLVDRYGNAVKEN